MARERKYFKTQYSPLPYLNIPMYAAQPIPHHSTQFNSTYHSMTIAENLWKMKILYFKKNGNQT